MSEEKPTYDVAQAQAAIAADKEHRTRACLEAIQQALRVWQCALSAVPVITPDGRIGAEIRVTAQ